MPLYEYRCTACNRLTEKRQKFSDPEITVCPHCDGTLERTITAPAIQFKGGGWFADGYGNKKPAAAGGTSEGSPATSENKSGDTAKPASSDSSTAASPAASAPATPAPSTSSPAK